MVSNLNKRRLSLVSPTQHPCKQSKHYNLFANDTKTDNRCTLEMNMINIESNIVTQRRIYEDTNSILNVHVTGILEVITNVCENIVFLINSQLSEGCNINDLLMDSNIQVILVILWK